jgi:uncharacterized phage-associated protein
MEKPKIKAIEAAYFLVNLASSNDENDLTNLKLQKLLYFAQGKYMAGHGGNPLFGEDIEAWDLGPVVRNVYHTFRSCGSFPITVFDIHEEPSKPNEEIATHLKNIWESIGTKYSASWLVGLTHKENTPWKRYYRKGENIIIPKEEIVEYFSKQDEI